MIPLAGRGQSKTFTLPIAIVDSLIFETRKGRACDTALNFALQTIQAKNSLIDGQGKIIELRAKEIGLLKELDANWSARLTNQAELSSIERQKLRNKVRKLGRIIFGESVGIGVLLALLLL
jgi:hypothetical protein